MNGTYTDFGWDLHGRKKGDTWEVRNNSCFSYKRQGNTSYFAYYKLFLEFFLVFSIKIHNFAKEQTFNSNNYGEFQ